LLDQQPDLFLFPDFSKAVDEFVRRVHWFGQPSSPDELVAKLDKEVGPKARWELERIVRIIAGDQKVSRSDRDYLSSLLAQEVLPNRCVAKIFRSPRRYRRSTSCLSKVGSTGTRLSLMAS
jgi:hypothetical protein